MIRFDLKALEASSILYGYIMTVGERKRMADFKKLLFVYQQLNRLESENDKAKRLIDEKQMRLIKAEKELAQLRSDISLLKNKSAQDQELIQKQIKTIDNLTEGLIARCDQCGS